MIHEWDITSTNLSRARARLYEVAVLPAGAIEAHNRHLPFGTDFRCAEHVARAASAAAWRRCPSVLCLPALPYGVDCNLMAFPLTVTVKQATLDAMIREIFCALRQHGLRKFVIVNGHGGNDFLPLVRQVQTELDIHVFIIDWWKVAADQYDRIFTQRDDHAGQFETSTALALFEQEVELANAADGAVRAFRFEALRQGWAYTSRDFAKMTTDCASGNPQGASAEKGKEYLELCIGRMADFLVEVACTPIDEFFPFQP